jgi:hypothetical protein
LMGEIGAGDLIAWAQDCDTAVPNIDVDDGNDAVGVFDLSALTPGTYSLCYRQSGTSESVQQSPSSSTLTVVCPEGQYDTGSACSACAGAASCSASQFYTVGTDACAAGGTSADTDAGQACATCAGASACGASTFYTEAGDACVAAGSTADTDAGASCTDCQGVNICADGEFYTVADDECAPGGTTADTDAGTACAACSGNMVCGLGTYYTAADDVCLNAGATLDTSTDEVCSDCQPGSETVDSGGSFTDAGAVACALCAAGESSDHATGGAACAACQRGHQTELNDEFSETGAVACTPCAEGTFSNAASGAAACAACTAGSETVDSGGTFVVTGALRCDECGPGTFAETEFGACANCAPGSQVILLGWLCCPWFTVWAVVLSGGACPDGAGRGLRELGGDGLRSLRQRPAQRRHHGRGRVPGGLYGYIGVDVKII